MDLILSLFQVSKNSINHFSPGALTGLSSLKELYVQYNELGSVPNLALRSPYVLKILDLSYNRMERVEDNSFSNLKEVKIMRFDSFQKLIAGLRFSVGNPQPCWECHRNSG